MKQIVWLASYPKSGNTWFRIFLTNLLRNSDQPANINELESTPIASARFPFDASLGYDSADLTYEEINFLRREFYLRQATEANSPLFLKVHDAYTFLSDGRPLFPPEATKAVLYFVRNPLDVCVSFAHHSGKSEYGKTVVAMGNPNHTMAGRRDRQHEQLPQKMFSWSKHVLSWINAPEQQVHVMRYEDMKLRTEETFSKATRFVELPCEPERIRKAIEFSQFEELRSQEEKKGFRERIHADRPFFRKGQIGSWREALTKDQVDKLIADHRSVMEQLGYIGNNGEPIF